MNNAYCYETKIGKIVIVENGTSITQLCFGEDIPKDVTILETDLLKEANKELEEYFRGKREKFDLSFDPVSYTHLIHKVQNFKKRFGRHYKKYPMGKLIAIKM